MSRPICFRVENDAGEEVEHSLPSRWEICDVCRGEGTRDHPAFRNGLTAEDFAEDPDFRGDYLSGRYDVACDACEGGKVLVPDEGAADPAVLELYRRQKYEEARDRRADEYTRRMENGGFDS